MLRSNVCGGGLVGRGRAVWGWVALAALAACGCSGTDEKPSAVSDGSVDVAVVGDAADVAVVGDATDGAVQGDASTDGGACVCSSTRGAQGVPTTSLECYFGGHVPTLAEVSPCNTSDPQAVQRVRTEYPACNRVVIGFSGYFKSTAYVFDRTTGVMLSAQWGDDTVRGCQTPQLDLSSCGMYDTCLVCAEDPREPSPPATCTRLNRDAGVDASTDGG